jgi:peptide-methionine (S)-S-oxide reductase
MRHDTHKLRLPGPGEALPGRSEKMPVPARHAVLGTALEPPFPAGTETALFGMGCFWGAERKFWETAGVVSTSVGYAGGLTPNPTYREVCSGLTGHNEVVRVVFDPRKVRYEDLLRVFWENHDPTQGMRQGNDVGTQYRSGIYWRDEAQRQRRPARRTRAPCAPRTRARSRPRSCPSPSSTMPRTTTSSTWRRTPAATAALAVPGSHARWA